MQTAPSDSYRTLIFAPLREIASHSFTRLGTTYSINVEVSALANKTVAALNTRTGKAESTKYDLIAHLFKNPYPWKVGCFTFYDDCIIWIDLPRVHVYYHENVSCCILVSCINRPKPSERACI